MLPGEYDCGHVETPMRAKRAKDGEKLLRHLLRIDPHARVLGMRVHEILAIVADWANKGGLSGCPACGAEMWVNVDCDVCMVCSHMLADGTPP